MALAVPFINLVLKKLDELLSEEIKLLLGVKRQLRSLHGELSMINVFLKEFDSKQTRNPELVKGWISRLRDAAFDAEDIIDNFFLEIDQRQHVGCLGSLKSCVICVGETPARHHLGTQIEDIKTTIREIFEQKKNFEIEIKPVVGSASCSANPGPSERDKAIISEGLNVVGFVDSEQHLMGQLLHGEGKRTVMSVVGMGGLGKTTIVKKIYNKPEIETHFKYRAWITVSRQYTVDDLLRSILKGILECIPGTRHDKLQIAEIKDEELVQRLKRQLKNAKYLVVIDDMWDTEPWDYINAALPMDLLGSRVIITSRNREVAVYAQAMIHELPFLTDEESWELFCMKVFRNDGCPSELEEVGNEMVKKCRGLPLAILVLGGLLSGKPRVRYEWQRIRDRLKLELSTERNQMIKDILTLSYDDLRYDLKLCFLYVGLFPEDVEIDATKLIQLWVAEGFIEEQNGCITEETAEDHLEKLADRSILQAVERDSAGRVSKCRIHDLLLDLAYTVGQENKFLDVHGHTTTIHEIKTRRLAIHQNVVNCFSSSKCLTPKLHTLLCFNLHCQQECNPFFGLTLLRVIDIEGAPIEMLPNEIGSMVRLKYLGLRRTRLTSLPSSIKKLSKLETLDIMDIHGISLPDAIWDMKTIRHIHACGVQPQSSCGSLRDLQTLHTATADRWIQSLGKLINLRKLGIEGMSISYVKVLSDSIRKLNQLKFLRLEGSSIPNVLGLNLATHERLNVMHLKGEMGKMSKLNPEHLPPNLTQITLDGSKLERDPLALLERLPYLSSLRLLSKSFVGERMICSAGGFPKLEELYLSNLTEIKHMEMMDGTMRCLKSLTIKDSTKLGMLPEGLQNINTLKELTLENMPPEFTDKIEEDGTDWYKVRQIPVIKIF